MSSSPFLSTFQPGNPLATPLFNTNTSNTPIFTQTISGRSYLSNIFSHWPPKGPTYFDVIHSDIDTNVYPINRTPQQQVINTSQPIPSSPISSSSYPSSFGVSPFSNSYPSSIPSSSPTIPSLFSTSPNKPPELNPEELKELGRKEREKEEEQKKKEEEEKKKKEEEEEKKKNEPDEKEKEKIKTINKNKVSNQYLRVYYANKFIVRGKDLYLYKPLMKKIEDFNTNFNFFSLNEIKQKTQEIINDTNTYIDSIASNSQNPYNSSSNPYGFININNDTNIYPDTLVYIKKGNDYYQATVKKPSLKGSQKVSAQLVSEKDIKDYDRSDVLKYNGNIKFDFSITSSSFIDDEEDDDEDDDIEYYINRLKRF